MPETVVADISDVHQNDASVLSTSSVEITGMIDKLTLGRRNSNCEESDVSSDDGRGDDGRCDDERVESPGIAKTEDSISTESKSSVVSSLRWTSRREPKQERQSRSSSESSDLSSSDVEGDSDDNTTENDDYRCIINKFNSLQTNDTHSNSTKSSQRGINSDNADRDTSDEYTQRAPIKLASRSRTYGYKPYNSPDLSLGGSPSRNNVDPEYNVLDLFQEVTTVCPDSLDLIDEMINGHTVFDQPGLSPDQILGMKFSMPPSILIDASFDDKFMFRSPPNTPLPTCMTVPQPIPSIGSMSSSNISSCTPSPMSYNGDLYDSKSIYELACGIESTTTNEPSLSIFDPPSPDVYFGTGINQPISIEPNYNGGEQAYSPIQQISSTQSNGYGTPGQLSQSATGFSPSTLIIHGPVSTGVVTVNPSGAYRVTENGQAPLVYPPNGNFSISCQNEPKPYESQLRWSLGNLNPTSSIPNHTLSLSTSGRDNGNTSDSTATYEVYLESLDTQPSRSSNKFKTWVPLNHLDHYIHYLLDKADGEFSATDRNGNTYLMVSLSKTKNRKHFACILVTLEKMQRVPGAFLKRNTDGHDALYMAAINFPEYEFMTGLVLEKILKALGAFNEIWKRTYDDLNNTLIHIVAAKGDAYVMILQELLDLKTIEGRAVFHLSARNIDGKTPLQLAVEAQNPLTGVVTKATVKLLRQHGADLVAEGINGDAALHMAISSTCGDSVVEGPLNTPVHLSAAVTYPVHECAQLRVCQLLIDDAGLVNRPNLQNETLMELVAADRHESKMNILLQQ